MDASVISQKREDLKNAMSDLCKSAESNQKLCDTIKERGFWERVFSNNTRDLARAGIAQQELFDKLQRAVQGLMEIVQDGHERERQFIGALDELRMSVDQSVSELHDAVSKVVGSILKENAAISRLRSSVSAGSAAAASIAAANKCVAVISEYCKKASSVTGEEFCALLNKTVSGEFGNKKIFLRNEDKKFLLRELSEVIGGKIEYDQGYGKELMPIEIVVERELEKLAPEGDSYTSYRDELVRLIDDLLNHKNEIDPQRKSVRKLSEVKERLLESQFEIALIGEFQGGKSTTFNALCGGREISPRGLGTGGVKTSAAVITAQNISGSETRNGLSEWAEINWLSKEKLHDRISDALGLDNRNSRPSVSVLENTLKKKWQELSQDDDDSRDLLQVATLQLRLLKAKDFSKYTSRTIVGIAEFQKYVQFPKNWEMRWGEKDMEADFSLEESLFAALDSVLVRLHSEYLQRLGCRITDCPGLFVSKWDTERAFEVMRRSNAIWYLLGGSKEMGKDQKNVLPYIRKGGWHTKCFFTLNVRGDENSTEGILQANVAKIKKAKFNVENHVFKYNAAVAFRLAQIECVQAGKFGKRDIDCLAVESANRRAKYEDLLTKFSSDGGPGMIKAIRQQIYTALAPTGYSVPEHSTMSDKELADDLEVFAGLKNIVRALECHIVSHGAAAILLGDSGSGAELCKLTLEELRGDKKAVVESANRDFEEAKKHWAEDDMRLTRFKRSVAKEFRFLDENTGLDDKFLRDFYDLSSQDIHDGVQESAIDITIEEWQTGHMTNTGVREAATRRIKEAFSHEFKLRLNAYGKDISSTQIYKKEIGERIRLSWEDLKREWNEMEKDNPHFEGLCPDESVVDVEINPFCESIDQTIEIPSYFLEFFRNIGNAIASLFGATRENSEDRIRRFFREKDPIGDALKKMEDSYFKSIQFKALFAQARTQNKQKIDASMENVEQKFRSRIEQEKLDMSESESVKKQKADEAKRVSDEVIDPRILKIEDFMARVKATYGN